MEVTSTRFCQQNRCFSASHYTKFPFVEYSVERDAIFCFPCHLFQCSVSEITFTHEEYNNWKDVNEAVAKHGKSRAHSDVIAKCAASKHYTKTDNGSD